MNSQFHSNKKLIKMQISEKRGKEVLSIVLLGGVQSIVSGPVSKQSRHCHVIVLRIACPR